MKRLIVRVVAILLLSVLAIGTFQVFAFKNTVATIMSKSLGVDVDIGSIRLGLNSVTVNDLEIENIPEGTLNPALAGHKIHLSADVMELLRGERIVVNEIIVLAPSIAVEAYNGSGNDNNWSRMMKGFGGDKSASSSEASAEETQAREWEIKHLVVKDISVRLKHPAAPGVTLQPTIPDIELNNVTSVAQIPMDVLTRAVMDHVLKETIKDIPQLLQDLPLEPAKAVDKVLNGKELAPVKDAVKGLFDK